MPRDSDMPDGDAIEEEQLMYGHGALTKEEMKEKYPNRPHNIHKTLPFHELFTTLFNPLNDARKRPGGPAPIARKKQGPHGRPNLSPQEARRAIIERFISKWRKLVGNDIYPAFRLIVPEKDRDRAMYGLKEKTIGKLLVKIIGIDKSSEDAYNLMNWKLPGFKASSASAGDFAGRCFEVLSKRPILTRPGTMTVAEVNERLDRLAAASKENEQVPLFEEFYRRMNPEELMWLVRMMLRQMKIGATEKTLFDIWHPDAEALFNVSSSLRRVCWELHDPNLRLDTDKSSVTLMQCFQPQLAHFQQHSFQRIVESMRPVEGDDEFWIEEKLDGERIQMHMTEDVSVPGARRFSFWSRKGKDYTYLYGSGLEDGSSALTQHLKNAFHDNVRNIILDGEMITWNMEFDKIVTFGTLKTAALAESRNPFSGTGERPIFKVFDCLYLNDTPITNHTLRDRRRALQAAVKNVDRRLELHDHTSATKATDIDTALREVVSNSSEGLVIKNPRSAYKLSERNDSWWKVKPEYMSEFGEALDCVVIGGYFGSGRRGGMLSSFLCGLRSFPNGVAPHGVNEQKCHSFFKVGGGMCAADYKQIQDLTRDKWMEWNPRKPPSDWIEIAGGDRQHERPDMWIKPQDSVVLEVKAASVGTTDQFATGYTLRFPRFKRLREDKTWREALTMREFVELKNNVEQEQKEKAFKIDDERKKRRAAAGGAKKRRKPLTVQGGDDADIAKTPYAGPATQTFTGLTFLILSDSTKPFRKTRAELESFVKANGGAIVQTQSGFSQEDGKLVCVADKELVKVRSIKKEGKFSIVRPAWLFDAVEQAQVDADLGREPFLLPMEMSHMFSVADGDRERIESNADEWGDGYARDITVEALRGIFVTMPVRSKVKMSGDELLGQFEEHGLGLEAEAPGWVFKRVVAYVDGSSSSTSVNDLDGDVDMQTDSTSRNDVGSLLIRQKLQFGGAKLVDDISDETITHIVLGDGQAGLDAQRRSNAAKGKLARIVTSAWVTDSFKERALLDEERFVA